MKLRVVRRRHREREIDRGDEADHRLPEELRARRQPLRIAVDDLALVVDPADRAEAERHEQHDPDEAVGEVAPQQRRDRDRHQDQRAAHRRRAGLGEVRLRAVVAHRLADLHPRQPGDHPRADDERDEERRHAREHRAQRDVAEDVERADVLREQLGEPAAASVRSLRRGAPVSAATTRSIRMKREPLTSTVAPGARVARRRAAASASTDAKCSRACAERRGALARRACRPSSRRSMPRGARVGADLAVERGALRADLAHVAQHQPARRRRARASTSIAARTESGFAL